MLTMRPNFAESSNRHGLGSGRRVSMWHRPPSLDPIVAVPVAKIARGGPTGIVPRMCAGLGQPARAGGTEGPGRDVARHGDDLAPVGAGTISAVAEGGRRWVRR